MIIGKFSNRTRTSPYTLRYYEKKGLLSVKRDAGGRRNYREEDVEWVKFIKCLMDTGMLLRDTKHYSDLWYQGDDTMEERMGIIDPAQGSRIGRAEEMGRVSGQPG